MAAGLIPRQRGGMVSCLDHSIKRHIQSGTTLISVVQFGGWGTVF